MKSTVNETFCIKYEAEEQPQDYSDDGRMICHLKGKRCLVGFETISTVIVFAGMQIIISRLGEGFCKQQHLSEVQGWY